MADATYFSSSSSENYDVFLSFRGKDTRKKFIAHIHQALCTKEIKTFKDNINLKKGDRVEPALLQAIENSHLCIVVLSERFAYSTWCLRELTHILKCKAQKQQVIPVFYDISPSVIGNLTGSYKDAFNKHKRKAKYNKKIIQEWKSALQEVAKISGFDSKSDDYENDIELIDDIVKRVWQRLESIYPQSAEQEGLVGIDKIIADMENLSRETRIIGLWGMGGIGKTTIAKALYENYSNSSPYKGRGIVKGIREKSNPRELESLHEQLLKDLFGGINTKFSMVTNLVKRKLKSMTAFIVLDDVGGSWQIDQLVEGIAPNSTIIITTRDRSVLNGKVHIIHEVEGLGFDKSLLLFSLNAFKLEHPPMEFKELSAEVAKYTQGLPLALKLLGILLSTKEEKDWRCVLTNLKENPHPPIDSVLKLSYDELNSQQKKIFLDIAFFLKREARDDVEKFLNACNFKAADELKVLEDKALITISKKGEVEMHDLIQEMGWKRVQEVYEDNPGRRSHLRKPEEIYDILKNSKGSKSIEGIILDMSAINDLHLNADSFKKMINLRFLKFYTPWYRTPCEVYIPLPIELISDKLSYFQWDACPLRSLRTFCPGKLVELRMAKSHVKELWDGVQNIENLRIIDLRESKNLIKLPSLSKASNLEQIDLSHCKKLRHVDLSFSCPPKLRVLDLFGCLKLKSLQSNTPLKSLTLLNVQGCSSLKEFSLNLEEIMELDLGSTKIEILPLSIGRCSKLKRLYLPPSLKNLSDELSKLKSLQKFVLGNCKELDTGNLAIILNGLRSLQELDLSGCCNLSHFPNSLGALSSLEVLRLDRSSVESLPTSITHLSQLRTLSVQNCPRLRDLPEIPPTIHLLKANNCTSLKTMSTLMEPKVTSCQMDFLNCVTLDEKSLSCVQAYLDFIIQQIEASEFDVFFPHRIKACFPGNEMPGCFFCGETERGITIEIPPGFDLKGFTFCVIISPDVTLTDSAGFEISCACNFVNGKTVKYRYEHKPDPAEVHFNPSIVGMISKHVCIWYEDHYFMGRLNRIEEKANNQCTNISQKVFIEFSFSVRKGTETTEMNQMVKGCGVRSIFKKHSFKTEGCRDGDDQRRKKFKSGGGD